MTTDLDRLVRRGGLKMLEKYRPSMDEDVLRSWAEDAQLKIDLLTEIVSELSQALNPHYMMSEQGREYMAKMAKALSA